MKHHHHLLLLLLPLCAISLAHDNVFDKYIQLKQSFKKASLPAHNVLPQPEHPAVDPDTGVTEAEMRAAMLAKPSNETRTQKHHAYASGHTFLPSVNATKSSPSSPGSRKPSPHPSPATRPAHPVPPQELADALVGQGGRTGVTPLQGQHVSRSPWKGSKAVPVVLVSVLVWACAIASRKTGATRKARVLRKRLTNPRMVA